MPSKYPDDFKARAVRLVDEARDGTDVSEYQATERVATRLGVAPESVRRWRRQALIDAGAAPGRNSGEAGEVKRLRRENAELKRANEILRTASAFFVSVATAPRRNDPIRRCVSRPVRGRGHLPHPSCDGVWVHHLARIPCREDAAALGQVDP